MALIYTPENLLEECEGAVEHNLKHLAHFPQVIQTFVGSFYRNDMRPVDPSPENYPCSYVSNVRPRLVFTNPRFNASAESTYLNETQLSAQAAFVNRWTVQNNLQKLLVPYVSTALLLRSVILTTFEDDADDIGLGPDEMKRKMPRCHLLENNRYFRDPVSTPATPPRYKGHKWVRDLSDVKKMPGVSEEIVSHLVPDIELKELVRPNDMNGGRGKMPPRFEIVAYEVWVPECNDYKTDAGHHGTLFTIAIGQKVEGKRTSRVGKSGFLLPPRPYYGPKWGPYTELEYIDVPGQTYGTSPVSVVMEQVEEVNAHLAATADAAARMKHLLIIDAANDTLAIAVQNSPDGTVLGIPNVTKDQITQVLVGGAAPEQYQYNEIVRQRLDRNIGMDAAQRGGGGTSQSQTATYTNIQAETLNVRMDDLKRTTTQAVMQIANTVSWYGWNSNNVVMRLGGGAGEEMGLKNPVYLGGPNQGEQLPPWDECALQLEPYSMEPVNEELLAQQVTEALAIITQMAQEMQTAPWLNFDVVLTQLAKLRKFDWIEDCINSKLFSAWMQEQTQQGLEKHQTEQMAQQMAMQMQHAQMQGVMLDNAKKQLELQLAARQGNNPDAPKPPTVTINYANLPEDMKRDAEMEAFGTSSKMPLTSPQHIQNAMSVHKANAGMQQSAFAQAQNQRHDMAKRTMGQAPQERKSQLAKMLGNMATGKKKQSGPVKARSGGQKALAASQ